MLGTDKDVEEVDDDVNVDGTFEHVLPFTVCEGCIQFATVCSGMDGSDNVLTAGGDSVGC